MGLPNDSILVTPGTGATLATELISAKEYQVVMLADAYGHIKGGRDLWVSTILAAATAASKHYVGVLNAAASGKIVEVVRCVASRELTAAVTGTWQRGFRVYRTTAMTAGTAITPVKAKTASAALPTQITSVTAGTTTVSGVPLGMGAVNDEETVSDQPYALLFDELTFGEPIILVEGEGVTIQQDATAGVGTVSASIAFRVR